MEKDNDANAGGKQQFKRRVSPSGTSFSLKKAKTPGWSHAEVNLAKVIIDFVY